MAPDRRMTTDRFFGGVDSRLQNLRSMLAYVDSTKPNKADLWRWLKRNTAAESDSTIEKYIGFQRSIELLTLQDDQYQTTSRGAEYAETGENRIVVEALLEHVKGFETILQAVEDEFDTSERIQSQLQEEYPRYKLTEAVVGRHLEWLQAVDALNFSGNRFTLTSLGETLLQEETEDAIEMGNLEMGERYHRVELHDKYGGARYRGIAPSSDHPYVFLFTGDSGSEHGYEDEFRGDTFVYTGEGREGDMEMSQGNKAIRDHKEDRRELHLFENNDEAWSVTYLGQFECVDWFHEQLPDTNGDLRKAIRFKLEPVNNEVNVETDDLEKTSLDTLYERAKESSAGPSERKTSTTKHTRKSYSRSEVVREYALRSADGVCQGCGEDAPFVDDNEEPFLEVHHLYRRSDGGPDDPNNVIALCPNCHRRVHHGKDGDKFNQGLIDRVRSGTPISQDRDQNPNPDS